MGTKPQWERFVGPRQGGAATPGMRLRISPRNCCTLSRDLVRAMGMGPGLRGLALYRWEHDGEVVVRLEAVPIEEGDFRVSFRKTKSGGFMSQTLARWLGLPESRTKRVEFEVSELDGEFIFEAKGPKP